MKLFGREVGPVKRRLTRFREQRNSVTMVSENSGAAFNNSFCGTKLPAIFRKRRKHVEYAPPVSQTFKMSFTFRRNVVAPARVQHLLLARIVRLSSQVAHEIPLPLHPLPHPLLSSPSRFPLCSRRSESVSGSFYKVTACMYARQYICEPRIIC